MEPHGDQEHETARRRLLEEGALSYCDAVNALIAYREEVQKICRTVVEKHLDDYSSALQIRGSLKKGEIKDVDSRSPDEDEDGWNVGVKIVRETIIPSIRSWELWCFVFHGPGKVGPSIFISEWFSPKRMAEELGRRFANSRVEHDGNDLWIREDLKTEEIHNLESRLEGLFKEWIKCWKKAGGIKKVFQE